MQVPSLACVFRRTLPFSSWLQKLFSSETEVPSTVSHTSFFQQSELPQLPGGSPLSLCPVSTATDVFQITSVEITKQPLYIDDVFFFHVYGSFIDTFDNGTIEVYGDCGSHCEEYGAPPGERPRTESWTTDFCNATDIEQPLGHPRKNYGCPPVEGYALLTSMGYVFPMVIHVPGWYNITFDAKTTEGKRIYCLTAEVCLKWDDPKKNEGYGDYPWTRCKWPR